MGVFWVYTQCSTFSLIQGFDETFYLHLRGDYSHVWAKYRVKKQKAKIICTEPAVITNQTRNVRMTQH